MDLIRKLEAESRYDLVECYYYRLSTSQRELVNAMPYIQAKSYLERICAQRLAGIAPILGSAFCVLFIVMLILFGTVRQRESVCPEPLPCPSFPPPIPCPTPEPTIAPTGVPTSQPTVVPTPEPTIAPTIEPTSAPTPGNGGNVEIPCCKFNTCEILTPEACLRAGGVSLNGDAECTQCCNNILTQDVVTFRGFYGNRCAEENLRHPLHWEGIYVNADPAVCNTDNEFVVFTRLIGFVEIFNAYEQIPTNTVTSVTAVRFGISSNDTVNCSIYLPNDYQCTFPYSDIHSDPSVSIAIKFLLETSDYPQYSFLVSTKPSSENIPQAKVTIQHVNQDCT